MRKRVAFLLILLPILSACQHWLSPQSRQMADPSLTLSEIRSSPERYRGRLVLIGGTIAATMVTPEEIQLEIVEHPLDRWELPDQLATSRGRFLAVTTMPLNLGRFQPQTVVTMMGEITGQTAVVQGNERSAIPVIGIREIRDLPEIHPEEDYDHGHHFFGD